MRGYERADAKLGLEGALVSNYDRAIETDISAQIKGWFTTKRFSNYLPANGPATIAQFTSGRCIINGIDRAKKVAGHAMSFQAALTPGAQR